eukprot:EC825406.1.p1 GENE.EC825406.1~~EC825406.1.p1  ORF type:complete len:122 (+),score=50.49 EC825406.1:2-367(+)
MDKDNFMKVDVPKYDLEKGFQTNNENEKDLHPLQENLIKIAQKDINKKNFTLAKVYGASFVHHLEMEKQIIKPLRLPSLESENLASDILSGNLDKFSVSDLQFPLSNEVKNLDVHKILMDI